VQNQRIK